MEFLVASPIDWKWVGAFFHRDSMYRNVAVILRALWFSVASLLLPFLRFLEKRVFRIKGDDVYLERESDSQSSPMQHEFEDIFFKSIHDDDDEEEEEEKEKFKFEFRFSFQNPEITTVDKEEKGLEVDSQCPKTVGTDLEKPAASFAIDNYRFLGERDVSGFICQPEVPTFSIKESFVGDGIPAESWAVSSTEEIDKELRKRFTRLKSWENFDSEEKGSVEASERQESVSSCDWGETTNEYLGMEDANVEDAVFAGDVSLQHARGFGGLSSSGSLSGGDGYSVKDLFCGYDSDELFSEKESDDRNFQDYRMEESRDLPHTKDVGSAIGVDDGMDNVDSSLIEELEKESCVSEEGYASSSNKGSAVLGGDEYSFSMDRNEIADLPGLSIRSYYLEDDSDVEDLDEDEVLLRSFEDMNLDAKKVAGEVGEENLILLELEHELNDRDSEYNKYQGDSRGLDPKISGESDEEIEEEFKVMERDLDLKSGGEEGDFGVSDVQEVDDSNEEEEGDPETLWEHEDLIEQLKSEIKKAKGMRLPTIQEESETTAEDLKPWNTEAKFFQEDPMQELYKFYKAYRERMRKLDVLNLQKMSAIEFLQLKDTLQSIGVGKLKFASHFSENLWPCLRKKDKSNPTDRFLGELQSDLENIYVGQLCLSWEFLWWQYEKFQEFSESSACGDRQYSQAAGEFQRFHVPIQRFLEDEPFRGARVPNYVKTRCVLPTMLQVPFIREDSRKNEVEDEKKGGRAITSQQLSCTMENSIRILWLFIKSDKDETPTIVKSLIGNRTELQHPTDYQLMAEIQANLCKKEKKLKDLLRIGNCLVRKFKKPQEQRLSKDLFCSRLDMKLVSRVLEMPRITREQLVWCHEKLDKITFSERRLHREPSFLLFPC